MILSKIRVTSYRSIADSGDLTLGPATVVIGRNNSGKSSLLRALCTLQAGASFSGEDVRIGEENVVIRADVTDVLRAHLQRMARSLPARTELDYRVTINKEGGIDARVFWQSGQAAASVSPFSMFREESLIVPILARRKADGYDTGVSTTAGRQITVSDRGLTSRILTLSTGQFKEARRYRELTEQIFGVPIATFLTNLGQQPGLPLSAESGISLDRMGEGVSGALKLLTEIVSERPRFYIVEEPETDLHPKALVDLLEIMTSSISGGSQFLVSTHNDLVLKHLGSIEGAKVLRAQLEIDDDGIPTTKYSDIEGSFARREALSDLGYEMSLPMGWLILEESTMEQFLSGYLIPSFAPKVAALRTVSARGAGNLRRSVEDLHRFALYAHLALDAPRLWVIADGDKPGRDAVDTLRQRFDWPVNRFQSMQAPNLESLYPEQFQGRVEELAYISDRRLRGEAKAVLLREVLDWCNNEPGVAETFFAERASDLIAILREIEATISGMELP